MSMTNHAVCDLYNIPNDDHKTFRLKKFVEYQHEVPPVDTLFISQFVRKFQLDVSDVIWLIWTLSVIYSEITSVFLYFVIKDKKTYNYQELWDKHKNDLIFGSAKMWNKRKDLFAPLMNEFNLVTKGNYADWFYSNIGDNEHENYRKIYNSIASINNCSRLSADFFIEPVVNLKDYLKIRISEPPEDKDWKNCENLTSGILNIYYKDDEANEYDKSKKIKDIKFLDCALLDIQKAIKKTYPHQNSELSAFKGKICSFRNLFKGARYAGFHHDRQLETINQYAKTFPDYKPLWNLCFQIRSEVYQHRFLGELNGWTGIRKERKKLWLTQGLTGAEL